MTAAGPVPPAAPGLAFSDIEAGRDVRVTVYQGVAFPQPVADLRYAAVDFSQELGQRTGFVGRRALFADLAGFQDTHTCGYLRLVADAGLGKTAVAAEVARRFAAEAFFVDAGRGLTTAAQCLGHLCAALIARFDLPYDRLPVVFEDSSFFSHVVSLAVDAAGGRLWLVVDGLDEAADPGPSGNVLLLPPRLPPGVFVFTTQRPGVVPLRTSPDTAIADLAISADSPDDRADLREFLVARAADADIAVRLAEADPPVPADAFVARVLDASQGNFMVAGYLLADISDGTRPVGSADLTALPRGLSGYYTDMWRRMAAAAEQDGPEQWERLYRPAMGLLAVAGEPVTAEWLASLLGVPPTDVRRRVLRRWRRFIVAAGERGRERWRFVHRSFHDFLVDQDEVYLPDLHAEVAAAFADPSAWPAFDGYAARHLVTHLAGSGDLEAALALVRDQEWYAAQLAADPTAVLMSADVTTVAAAVAAVDDAETAAGGPARWLGEEIRLTLYARTITGFLRGIGPRMLRLLVETGVLGDAQVLAVLDRDPGVGGRGRALLELADVLHDDLLDEAWRLAVTLRREDHRAAVLLALSARMPVDVTVPVLTAEARGLLERAVEDPDGLSHLGSFLEVVPEDALRLELHHAVGHAALDVEAGRRTTRLAHLIAVLGPENPIRAHAVEVLRASLTPDEGLAPYITTLDVLPPEHRDDVVAAALAIVTARSDPEGRAAGLVELAPHLEPAARQAALAEAFDGCRGIEVPLDRLRQLADLFAVAEDPELQWAVVDAVRETAAAVDDPYWLASALAPIIARCVPEVADDLLGQVESELRGSAPERWVGTLRAVAEELDEGPLRDRLLKTALRQARSITNDLTRARALLEVAADLPVGQARPVAAEAVRTPGGLLAAARQEDDTVDRALLLARVAAALDDDRRTAAAGLAEDLIGTGGRPYDRGRVLAGLLPLLTGSHRDAVLDELHALWLVVVEPGERAELGLAMLGNIPEAERQDFFQQVLESALAIEPGDIRMNVIVGRGTDLVTSESLSPLMGRPTEALVRLAGLDPVPERRPQLLATACDLVYDMPDDLQPDALRAVAPLLDLAQCHRILDDYRLVLNDPRRHAFVQGIEDTIANVVALRAYLESRSAADGTEPADGAPVVPPDDAPAGPPDDQDDGGITVSCWAEGDHLFGLSRRPGQNVIEVESDGIDRFEPDKQREIELASIRWWTSSTANGGDPQVLGIPALAEEFALGSEWPTAIGAVLRRLAELTSVEDAFDRAGALWPDGFPPVVAAAFAERRPDDGLLDALAQVDDPLARAIALVDCLHTLRAPQRARAERLLSDTVSEWEAGRPPRCDKAARNLLDRDGLTPSLRLRLVRYLLDRSRTRRRVLQAVTELLIPILDVGGPGTADKIAAAIRDVSDRWPD